MRRANNFEYRIINSRLFKFIVGENCDGIPTEFSVHEEAIAQLSKPLQTLVKGDLSEAQAGCTIWKDVSKETFERFVQVAYTGDYSIPNTRKCNRVTEPEKVGEDTLVHRALLVASKEVNEFNPREEGLTRDDWGVPAKSKKKKSKYYPEEEVENPDLEPEPEPESSSFFRTKRDRYPRTTSPSPRLFAAVFHSLKYPLLSPRDIHHHTCEPVENFEPSRSYSNVFLAHASLYVLGDYWLIDSLKALALYKLHKTLCVFKLEGENIQDIVDLARYAYIEGKGVEEGIGKLRTMVCQYMALNALVLSPHTGFTDFLAEGGQFVKDFFQFAIQRMQ